MAADRYGKFISSAVLGIIILSFALLLCSCNDRNGSNDITDGGVSSETTAVVSDFLRLTDMTEGKAFKVIRPDVCDNSLISAISLFVSDINKSFGCSIGLSSDWSKSGENDGYAYEILIGDTNRRQSRELLPTLKYDDSIICVKDGKLVILGGSDEATLAALERFRDEYVDGKSGEGEIEFPVGEKIEHKKPYKIEKLTVGGVDIAGFKIIYSYSDLFGTGELATELKNAIRNACGTDIEVKSDREEPVAGTHEILIGNTKRGGAEVTDAEYNIYISEGSLYLRSTNLWTCHKSVEAVKNLLEGKAAEKELSDSSGEFSIENTAGIGRTDGTDIRVMSSNVLFVTDNKKYATYERMAVLSETYLMYLPDCIGFQEMSEECRGLIAPALKEYYEEAPANNKGVLNTTPVFYRKDLYTVKSSGYERFLPDNWTKSIGWAVLERKSDGKLFAVTSAHYSLNPSSDISTNPETDGVKYREENSRQLLSLIEKLCKTHGNIPIIATGDYFSGKGSNSYGILTKEVLTDAAEKSEISVTDGYGTHHTLGYTNGAGTGIDLVLYTDETLTSLRHKIIMYHYYLMNATDHSPVFADFKFK